MTKYIEIDIFPCPRFNYIIVDIFFLFFFFFYSTIPLLERTSSNEDPFPLCPNCARRMDLKLFEINLQALHRLYLHRFKRSSSP